MTVERIGVAGAGTMGAGIAQVAALGGFESRLYDPDPGALEAGLERLRAALEKGAAKGLWSDDDAGAALTRVAPAPGLEELAGCELVIEACPEDLALKRGLFGRLAGICGESAILATNTSSLPVGAIAEGIPHPERLCGMHFFNPPALMRLVEVVAGEQTSEEVAETAMEIGRAMGREPVRAADSVGFIANRVNRPFTLEALAILDGGLASAAGLDRAMRDRGGFRMGPFEYMDLIGIDVNFKVAQSFYEQRPEHRWRPHPIQQRLVAEGRLGQKAGRGFYNYEDGRRIDPGRDATEDAGESAALVERIVCQLVNEAHFALGEGVATAGDIDTAMRLGMNHPRGPFEWAGEIGPARIVAALDALGSSTSDARYEVAPALRERGAG